MVIEFSDATGEIGFEDFKKLMKAEEEKAERRKIEKQ